MGVMVSNAGFISSTLNPKPYRSLTEPLKGTLIDPFLQEPQDL